MTDGLTISHNTAPIELVWEDMLDDAQLEVVGIHMPILRKNWKADEVTFAAYLAEIDNISMIEKGRERWEESLIIRPSE